MIKLTHLRNATRKVRSELNAVRAYVDKSRLDVACGFSNSLEKEYVRPIFSNKNDKVFNMADHNKEN
jgi:hypothetical protein